MRSFRSSLHTNIVTATALMATINELPPDVNH